MICETDYHSPCRMEVEETSPSNRKSANFDDFQQTFEFSTQNSTTQNQIAHNDPKFSSDFEEEIENDSSDFGASFPREPDYRIEKLFIANKAGKIYNTFEEDPAQQTLEQTSSRNIEEEKAETPVEFYNEPGPVVGTEPANITHHALENENMTQLLNSPVQKVQDLEKRDPASEKTDKKRVTHSVDDGKNHDLNCLPQDLAIAQAPTAAFQSELKTMDEDIKRIAAYRDHIPLISKAVLKYASNVKSFIQELVKRWRQNDLPVEEVSMYMKKNIKGKKEGLLTKNGTPKQQAKIANENDILGLLDIDEDDLDWKVKLGTFIAFDLFFEKGFYEHWVDEQYRRIWIKKGVAQADNTKRAFLTYKKDVSSSFLKYGPRSSL